MYVCMHVCMYVCMYVNFFLFSESVPPHTLSLVEKIAADIEKYLQWPYAGEIKGKYKHPHTSTIFVLIT